MSSIRFQIGPLLFVWAVMPRFFSALEKTGFLRIEIAGKSYNFNLSDIDSGSFRLASCLASMVMPAAGGEGMENAQANYPSSYRQEINGLRRQLNGLREENKRLSGLLKHGSGALTPAPDSGASEEIAALSSRVLGLEKENNGLRTKLDAAQRTGTDTAELESLKSENTKLQLALLEVQPDASALQVLQGKVKTLQAENDSLKYSLEDSGEAEDTAQIKTLKAENERLQANLAAQAEATVLADALKVQVEALNEEKDSLSKKTGACAK